MELDGVDVGVVALEVLHVAPGAHVPHERSLVAGLGRARNRLKSTPVHCILRFVQGRVEPN